MADHAFLHVFTATAIAAWVANIRTVPEAQKTMLWYFALIFLSLFLIADIAVLGIAAYLSAQNAYIGLVDAFESLVAYNTATLPLEIDPITANLVWFESLLQFLVIRLAVALYHTVACVGKAMVVPTLLLGLYLLLHCLFFAVFVAVSAVSSRIRRVWRKINAGIAAVRLFASHVQMRWRAIYSLGTTDDNADDTTTSTDDAPTHGESAAQVNDQRVHENSESDDKAQSDISEEDSAALGDTDRDEAMSQVDTQETHSNNDSGAASQGDASDAPVDSAEDVNEDDEASAQEYTQEAHDDTSSSEEQLADVSDADSDPGENEGPAPGEAAPKPWSFYLRPIWRVDIRAAYRNPMLLVQLGMLQEERWISIHQTGGKYPAQEAYEINVARYGTYGLRKPKTPDVETEQEQNNSENEKETAANDEVPVEEEAETPEDVSDHPQSANEEHSTSNQEAPVEEKKPAQDPVTSPETNANEAEVKVEFEREASNDEAEITKDAPIAEPEHVSQAEQSPTHDEAEKVSETQKADKEDDTALEPEAPVKEQEPIQDHATAEHVCDLESNSREFSTSQDEAPVEEKASQDHDLNENFLDSVEAEEEQNSIPLAEAPPGEEETLAGHVIVNNFSEAPNALDEDKSTPKVEAPVEEARIERDTLPLEHDAEEIVSEAPLAVNKDQPSTHAEVPSEEDNEVQLTSGATPSPQRTEIGEPAPSLSNGEDFNYVPGQVDLDTGGIDELFNNHEDLASGQQFDRQFAALQQAAAPADNVSGQEQQSLPADAGANGDGADSSGGDDDTTRPQTTEEFESVLKAFGRFAGRGSVMTDSQPATAANLNVQSTVSPIEDGAQGADTENFIPGDNGVQDSNGIGEQGTDAAWNFGQPTVPFDGFTEGTFKPFTTGRPLDTATWNATNQGDDSTSGYPTNGTLGSGFQSGDVGMNNAPDDEGMTDPQSDGIDQGLGYDPNMLPIEPPSGAFTGYEPGDYQEPQVGDHIAMNNPFGTQQASTAQGTPETPMEPPTGGPETLDTEMDEDSPVDVDMQDGPPVSHAHDTATNSAQFGNIDQNGQPSVMAPQQGSSDGGLTRLPLFTRRDPFSSQSNVFTAAPAAPSQPAQIGAVGQGARPFLFGLQQPTTGFVFNKQQGSMPTPAPNPQPALIGSINQGDHFQFGGSQQQQRPGGSFGFDFTGSSAQPNSLASLGNTPFVFKFQGLSQASNAAPPASSIGASSAGDMVTCASTAPPQSTQTGNVGQRGQLPSIGMPQHGTHELPPAKEPVKELVKKPKRDSGDGPALFAPLPPKEVKKTLEDSTKSDDNTSSDEDPGMPPQKLLSLLKPEDAEKLASKWLEDSHAAIKDKHNLSSTIDTLRARLEAIKKCLCDEDVDWDSSKLNNIAVFSKTCRHHCDAIDVDLAHISDGTLTSKIGQARLLCINLEEADTFQKNSEHWKWAKRIKQSWNFVRQHGKKLGENSIVQILRDKAVVDDLKNAARKMNAVRGQIRGRPTMWESLTLDDEFGDKAKERAEGMMKVLRPFLNPPGGSRNPGYVPLDWLTDMLEDVKLIIDSVDASEVVWI